MELVTQVYALTRRFPRDEFAGLVGQLRRAAVSVPSNIAEGQARHGDADFRRFLIMARGSLAEIETQLMIASNMNYCKSEELIMISSSIAEIGKMLNTLIRKLNSKQ